MTTQEKKSPTVTELFGETIYTYTRKQAIEDGYQVNVDTLVPGLRKEAGFNYNVFFENSLYTLIEKAVKNEKYCNDWEGVIWDIFTMFKYYKNAGWQDPKCVLMKVLITGAGRKRNHWLKVTVGATDIDDTTGALTFSVYER